MMELDWSPMDHIYRPANIEKSLKGMIARGVKLRLNLRAPKARSDTREVWGHAPPENFRQNGAL